MQIVLAVIKFSAWGQKIIPLPLLLPQRVWSSGSTVVPAAYR